MSAICLKVRVPSVHTFGFCLVVGLDGLGPAESVGNRFLGCRKKVHMCERLYPDDQLEVSITLPGRPFFPDIVFCSREFAFDDCASSTEGRSLLSLCTQTRWRC